MALNDTVTKLGNAIINLVNSKILKANNEQNEKLEVTLSDLKAKIDDLVEQGGGTEISLMDFVNNTEVGTLNTTNKTIVGSINEVDSTISGINTTLDTIIKGE